MNNCDTKCAKTCDRCETAIGLKEPVKNYSTQFRLGKLAVYVGYYRNNLPTGFQIVVGSPYPGGWRLLQVFIWKFGFMLDWGC